MTSLDRQFRNTLTNFRNYRKDFAPQAVAAPAEPAADAQQPVTAKPQPKPPAIIESKPQKPPTPNEPTNLVVMTPKPPANDAPEEAA